jgi:hypothetical protein
VRAEVATGNSEWATAGADRRAAEEAELLLADYLAVRDDERQQVIAIAALFTILGAVFFAEATQLITSCPAGASGCTRFPALIYAVAPSPTFAVLAMAVLIGAEATLRYGYMLALEDELRSRAPGLRLARLGRPAFSWQEARGPLFVFGEGPFRRFPYPYLFVVMIVPLIALALPLTIYCLLRVHPLLPALAVGVLYALASALLLYGTALAWRADFWDRRGGDGG